VGAEARSGQADGSDALGAPESGRTGRDDDGGSEAKTFGHGDGGDSSGARDPRRTQEGGVERGDEGFLVRAGRDLDVDDLMPCDSLLLTEKGEEAKIQNEINAPSVMVDGGEGGRRADERGRRAESGGRTADPHELGRIGEENGAGEEETFGHGDGGDPSGARDPRRTVAHGDGGDPSGGRDPRRTHTGDGGDPSGADRDPRRTGVGESFGHGEAVASDGPLAAALQGERCDAQRRDQGALQVVPSGAGREQVVASENQQDWRRAQMERMQREWMRRRAAKQGGVREQPGSSEARGP
jgi:hypothetical protein